MTDRLAAANEQSRLKKNLHTQKYHAENPAQTFVTMLLLRYNFIEPGMNARNHPEVSQSSLAAVVCYYRASPLITQCFIRRITKALLRFNAPS